MTMRVVRKVVAFFEPSWRFIVVGMVLSVFANPVFLYCVETYAGSLMAGLLFWLGVLTAPLEIIGALSIMVMPDFQTFDGKIHIFYDFIIENIPIVCVQYFLLYFFWKSLSKKPLWIRIPITFILPYALLCAVIYAYVRIRIFLVLHGVIS